MWLYSKITEESGTNLSKGDLRLLFPQYDCTIELTTQQ